MQLQGFSGIQQGFGTQRAFGGAQAAPMLMMMQLLQALIQMLGQMGGGQAAGGFPMGQNPGFGGGNFGGGGHGGGSPLEGFRGGPAHGGHSSPSYDVVARVQARPKGVLEIVVVCIFWRPYRYTWHIRPVYRVRL